MTTFFDLFGFLPSECIQHNSHNEHKTRKDPLQEAWYSHQIQSIFQYSPECNGSQDYRSLAQEVMQQTNERATREAGLRANVA